MKDRDLLHTHIEVATGNEVGSKGLYELLRIVDPTLTPADIHNEKRRRKTFRQCKLLIHPDKNQDKKRCTTLFKKATKFYEDCCEILIPLEFCAHDKWQFLADDEAFPSPHTVNGGLFSVQFSSAAVQCLYARGAIAHGQPTECRFDHTRIRPGFGHGPQIFDDFGGTKFLSGAEDVKREIMEHGPVVSVSGTFGLPSMLLVGWTENGWLIKSLSSNGNESTEMPDYPCGIQCIAPLSSLREFAWQHGSVILELPPTFADDDEGSWMQSQSMSLEMEADDYRTFIRMLHHVRPNAPGNLQLPVLIRNPNVLAHSRKYVVKSIVWEPPKGVCVVEFERL